MSVGLHGYRLCLVRCVSTPHGTVDADEDGPAWTVPSNEPIRRHTTRRRPAVDDIMVHGMFVAGFTAEGAAEMVVAVVVHDRGGDQCRLRLVVVRSTVRRVGHGRDGCRNHHGLGLHDPPTESKVRPVPVGCDVVQLGDDPASVHPGRDSPDRWLDTVRIGPVQ